MRAFRLLLVSWRSLIPLALLLASGCVLPTRDNPHDGQNAPVARLEILDVGKLADCTPLGAAAADSSASIAFQVSRGNCIFLDARDSTDGNGDNLTFDFDLVDGPQSNTVLDELAEGTAILQSGGVAVIVRPFLRTLSLAPAALHFRVRADDGPAASVAWASLQLTNGRPAAIVPPSRSLPLGGFPWAAGDSYDVFFDGSRSEDPDGDPLTWCWRFPLEALPSAGCTATPGADGFICSESADDPCFHRVISEAALASYTAQVYVHDNAIGALRLTSRTELETVTVRRPNVWASSANDAFRRADSLFREVTFANAGEAAVSYYARPGTPLTAYLRTESTGMRSLLLESWPDGTASTQLSGALPVGIYYSATAADPAHGNIWVGGVNSAHDGTIRRYAVPSIGLTATAQPASPINFGAPSNTIPPLIIQVDSEGTAWVTHLRADKLERFDAAGASLGAFTRPGDVLGGVAPRPGASEMWTAWQTSGELLQHDVLTGVETAYPFPFVMFGMSFASPDALWVLTVERGLLLLDITLLEAGRTVDEATLVEVPIPVTVSLFSILSTPLVVDPATGDCQLSNLSSGRSWRVSPSGRVSTFEEKALPYAFDAEGALWYQGIGVAQTFEAKIKRGFTVASDHVVLGASFGGTGFVGSAFVPGTGGVWAAYSTPAFAQQTAEEGTTERTVSLVPGLTAIEFAPDAPAAWAESGSEWYSVDLSQSPATVTVAPGLSGADIVVPAPAGRDLWAVTAGQISSVSPAGAITPVYAIPEVAASVVRLDGADGVCVSSFAAGNIVMRRVLRGGGVLQLGTVAHNPLFDEIQSNLASATGPDYATCWIAQSDDFSYIRLVAFASDGTDLHDGSIATGGSVGSVSIYPVSAHAVWVLWRDSQTVRLVEFAPTVGGAITSTRVVPFSAAFGAEIIQ